MPTYQYACTACDERLEAVQSFTDAPLTECPACGGTLRKVFSAVGVVFKGSGFYKNDSRDAAKSKSSSTSSDSTAASGSSDGGSSSSGSNGDSSSGGSSSSGGDSSSGGGTSATKKAAPAPSTPAASKSA